jgi:hypothetical protein
MSGSEAGETRRNFGIAFVLMLIMIGPSALTGTGSVADRNCLGESISPTEIIEPG